MPLFPKIQKIAYLDHKLTQLEHEVSHEKNQGYPSKR